MRCFVFAALLLGWTASGLAEELPDYLRTALHYFSPDAPKDWAYTVTTTRNGVRMVERCDPSRPPASRWTLREWQGRPPTPDEQEKYRQSRPRESSGGLQGNFQQDDIEPGSLHMIQEDDDQASWSGSFRSTSAGADKMLGHLALTLIVDKATASISSFRLTLKEPYSPVLGVKMNQLDVESRFHPATPDRPALPAEYRSQFNGRILFFSTEEKLQVQFSDYTPLSTELSR